MILTGTERVLETAHDSLDSWNSKIDVDDNKSIRKKGQDIESRNRLHSFAMNPLSNGRIYGKPIKKVDENIENAKKPDGIGGKLPVIV